MEILKLNSKNAPLKSVISSCNFLLINQQSTDWINKETVYYVVVGFRSKVNLLLTQVFHRTA